MDTQIWQILYKLKEKDMSTYKHSIRVTDLVQKYSMAANLMDEMTQRLIFCSKLHDIGKLILPANILKKSGALTDSEWKAVREHPRFGSELILREFGCEHSWEASIVKAHHERIDGHGYPSGLTDKDIPVEARIISVADAIDVMMHGRRYQKPVSSQECKYEVLKCSGTQFDPEIANVFVHEIL